MQTVWRSLIIDPLSVSEGNNCGKLKIMSRIYEQYIQQYHKSCTYSIEVWSEKHLKAGFCLYVPCVRLPKSHGTGEGLVGRCLRDNRGLSRSLKGDNTCRLQSKSPFTVGMECVTNAVMQLSVCMLILLPTLNATLCICFGCSGNTDFCLSQLCRNLSDCTAYVEEMSCFVWVFIKLDIFVLLFCQSENCDSCLKKKTKKQKKTVFKALISTDGMCLQGCAVSWVPLWVDGQRFLFAASHQDLSWL